MAKRNFTATLKEDDRDNFFINFEASEDIGIGMRTVVLRLQSGTSLAEARAMTSRINSEIVGIRTDDLYWPNNPTKQ